KHRAALERNRRDVVRTREIIFFQIILRDFQRLLDAERRIRWREDREVEGGKNQREKKERVLFHGDYFFKLARTAASCPALPSFSFLCAMNFAYSSMKIFPGARKSNCSG